VHVLLVLVEVEVLLVAVVGLPAIHVEDNVRVHEKS